MVYYSIQKIKWIKQYPFLLLLIALATGILIQRYSSGVSNKIWLTFFFILTATLVVFHLIKSSKKSIALLRLAATVLSFLFLGSLLSFYQDVRHSDKWYGHYLRDTEAIVVKVAADEVPKERTNYVLVEAKKALIKGNWRNVHGAFKLYIYRNDSTPEYLLGESLILPNKLTAITNSGNPFGFNYAGYSERNGLFHQTFLSAQEVHRYKHSSPNLGIVINSKRALMNTIKANVSDSTTRALIEATLLNERASLDDELWKAYSVTGIVHIIAISGTHVMMLCGVLMFLLKWIRAKKWEWVKYLLAFALIWFYIALTNFPPSAVRAGAMFSLVAVGIKLNRHSNSINTWAGAAFLLLCYNPYWLYDVGVQLSFLAVLSILIFYKPIKRWMSPINKLTTYLWDGIAISIAAQILVFPLALYYFHQFPLLSVIANIPAAIYSFLLMTGSLLLFFLDSIHCPAAWLGQVLTWVTQGFHFIVVALAALTPKVMQHLYIDSVDFLLMMLAIVLFSLFCFKKEQVFLLGGLTTVCMMVVSFIVQDLVAQKQDRLVVYNVSKQSLVDVFKGKSVIALRPQVDTVNDKTFQYNLLPSRLGHRAMSVALSLNQSVQIIRKEKILYLNEPLVINTNNTFDIDYLVVGANCIYEPENWLATFSPTIIILDGSLPRWKAIKWKAAIEQLGTSVHWVAQDGAWVFPK